ncbi:MAG: helix-turn-helix transcriptional regulator [Cyanobacteria bacterium SZAS TMP-1]|nr:helix-turn-helix transcriptional regulator [Cyanobacteria bacterium SZAS TMP-1]
MTHYQIEPLLAQLVKTRKAKGLSQSQISSKLGHPQSYISSIENGKHDLRLSTFIELARVLELEAILVPRDLSPAVKQMIRDFEGEATSDERAFIPTGDADG